MTMIKRFICSTLALPVLVACSSQQREGQTLADIDVPARIARTDPSEAAAPDEQRIKSAYYDYLRSADAADQQRAHAALRIAELELAGATPANEAEFEANVRRAIHLLQTSLRDFPSAEDNDQRWYQLAKAHDQLGEAEQAIEALQQLVRLHPQTEHYVEAQFRMAEHAFVHGDYDRAEAGYSDILAATDNRDFTEKALFKRGWAQFKQERFDEALEDYFAALNAHRSAGNGLAEGEDALLDEYLRAVALSFLYLGGAPALAEHFADKPNDPFAYRTYMSVSNLLLQQQRFSDAVATLDAYRTGYPYGEGVVAASLQALNIWKDANFRSRYEQAFADFYTQYRPGASFWQRAGSKEAVPVEALRENLLLLASRYHNRFLSDGQQESFTQAEQWYDRYLQSFTNYARQDQIYPQYAQLLERRGLTERAFTMYERAAFDGEILLDKTSAYACIYLSDRLYQNSAPQAKTLWLDKHLQYAQAYAELYPKDAQAVATVLKAVQMAFSHGRLQQTVELANLLPDAAPAERRLEVGLLKAQALFDLAEYQDAELVYRDLLAEQGSNSREGRDLADKLALSIYQQGHSLRDSDADLATGHFLRVYQTVPQSELAPTALYDATALLLAAAQWDQAIHYLKVFSQVFPEHALQVDVGKKLSAAYLQADRQLEAAQAFESLARVVDNQEEQMAALWQAAELYSNKGDTASAIRTYESYTGRYKRPYPQYLEAMHRLSELYATDNSVQSDYWLQQIVTADSTANASLKTERTDFLAASAAFTLARKRLNDYDQIALVHPLNQSLQRKKAAMQNAVKLFGLASSYGHREFVTESTYHIGSIYLAFAAALMNSERPRGLNDDELEQYNILLEDQAFPFEDQAIEFYEANLARIADGHFDEWLQRSLAQLSQLFPARYARTGKAETFVQQL